MTSNTVIWNSTDEEMCVVKRACGGDAEAFAILYRNHRDRVHATCLRMIKDPFLAEDMLQQTFLCAFLRLRTFRGDSSFNTWLHRIAVNVVLMHFRRSRTTPTENATDDISPDAEHFHVQDCRLTHAVERLELKKAIASLPVGYRTMFVLHDVEGFEHAEIAAILGCTPGNTKSQLFKARRRLRDLLTGFRNTSVCQKKEKAAA